MEKFIKFTDPSQTVTEDTQCETNIRITIWMTKRVSKEQQKFLTSRIYNLIYRKEPSKSASGQSYCIVIQLLTINKCDENM